MIRTLVPKKMPTVASNLLLVLRVGVVVVVVTHACEVERNRRSVVVVFILLP